MDIIALRKQLSVNPETGVAEKHVRDLTDEEFNAVKPYIQGEVEWPEESAADDTTTDEDAAVADPAPVEEEPAPVEDAPIPVAQPREVVVAKSTIDRAKARKEKYTGLIAAQDAILAEAEPDYDFDEAAWRAWDRKNRAAMNEKARLAADYAMSRDLEDAEDAERVVAQSEFAHTVDSIGAAYELLKLPESYDTLVVKYDNWARKAMSAAGTEDHQAAFNRFQTDPEFAKQVGPLPEGWETLFIYMNAEESRKKNGGTLRANVLDLAHESGIFKKMRASDKDAAARALASKSDKALHQRATEPRPASISSGSGEPPEGPTIPRDLDSSRKFLQEQQRKRAAGNYKPTEEDLRNERTAREWVLDGGKGKKEPQPLIFQ